MSVDKRYPEILPYAEGFLKVSPVHTIYYEQCGNPDGEPVLFLHGGPGGGTGMGDRRYFDPQFYRVILIDQRGAGQSTPPACLEDNTTWTLIEDIEKIRAHLGIETWLVFGGSWGSTLSLTYAENHPARVVCLILRGIFTLRRSELLFFYQEGASHLFADAWEKYVEPIPVEERGDMMQAYHKRLTGDDQAEKERCALAWSSWEMATSKLVVDPVYLSRAQNPQWALQFARIESHFFVNAGFFKEGYVLENVDKIRHIPTTIVQGRYDVVCPFKTAWELHKRFPEAKFVVNGTSGHSAGEQDNTNSLVDAADLWRDQQLALKGLAAAVQPKFREKQPPGGRTQITFG
jgi:proline iminopeptidase